MIKEIKWNYYEPLEIEEFGTGRIVTLPAFYESEIRVGVSVEVYQRRIVFYANEVEIPIPLISVEERSEIEKIFRILNGQN